MQSKTEDIVRLYKAGTTQKVISKFLNVSHDHVRGILYRKGLTKRIMTKEEDQIMLSMAQRGVPTDEIAAVFDRPIRTIQYRLKKLGYERPVSIKQFKKFTHKWEIPKKQRSI